MSENNGWLPIETHKGHSGVLLGRASDKYRYDPITAFLDVTGVWRVLGSVGGMTKVTFKPTHWQPLPPPPPETHTQEA